MNLSNVLTGLTLASLLATGCAAQPRRAPDPALALRCAPTALVNPPAEAALGHARPGRRAAIVVAPEPDAARGNDPIAENAPVVVDGVESDMVRRGPYPGCPVGTAYALR
jgi:hypothetical protein